jgi:hypothetical protein
LTIEQRLDQLEKRKNKYLAIALTLMATLISLPALSHAEIVLSGTPVFRCVTQLSGNAQCDTLDEVKAAKLSMSVLRVKPGQYVWDGDGRELTLPSPGSHYEYWLGGEMYIKVWNQPNNLPSDFGDASWVYMEHTQMLMTTITYYGTISTHIDPLTLFEMDLPHKYRDLRLDE